MNLDFLTREVFDALIIGVIIIGLALAAVRLYADFTRPLPADDPADWYADDTQPHPTDPDTNPRDDHATNKETNST